MHSDELRGYAMDELQCYYHKNQMLLYIKDVCRNTELYLLLKVYLRFSKKNLNHGHYFTSFNDDDTLHYIVEVLEKIKMI